MNLVRSRRSGSRVWLVLACGAGAWLTPPAMCAPLPGTAASAPPAEMTPAERARRDADNVYRWILIHADKPRKAVPAREDKPAASGVARPRASARGSENAAAAAERAPSSLAAEVPAPASVAPQVADGKAMSPTTGAAGAVLAPADTTSTVATPSVVATGAALSPPSASPVAAASEALDEALTVVSRVNPRFPPDVLRNVRAGQVRVRFTVQTDGSVVEPVAVSSSNPRLAPAALAAVAQWRFAPLRKAQSGVVDLGFNLD